MNILTKISIVVLVVLSLFACAVFITQASVVPNYASMYNQEKNKAEVNLMQANNAQVALLRAQQEAQALKTQLEDAKRDAGKKADDSDRNILALQGDLAAAKRELDSQKATNDKLAVTVASLTDRTKALSDELTASRKETERTAEDNRRVTQQYQEASAQLERGQRQAEYYQEQIADLQKQIEDVKSRGVSVSSAGGGATIDRVASANESRYTGSITSVKDDMAGVNIGSSNGVKKGDRLYVYRGAKFVAYLKIETVDANNSAGILSDRQADVSVNDKVTNKLE